MGESRSKNGAAAKAAFFIALFLISASTLMYEIVLTRLLSVVSWYYLAFVSISLAMFGMTAGALAVQLRPQLFTEALLPRRITYATFAMAISMPLALVTMLAIPIELSRSAQTLFSFLIFSTVIAVPFFFSGVAVCLSLTRAVYPIGHIYFVDLLGAAAGCFGALALLKLLDAPSAVFAISALVFLSAAGYARHAGIRGRSLRWGLYAALMLLLAGLNAFTLYGIQPIWAKGSVDPRNRLLAEVWNPISKVRAVAPYVGMPTMYGPSPKTPEVNIATIDLDIDNDASTPLMNWHGDPKEFNFLNYDITSVAMQMRAGGTAAVIGMGGGRDVFAAVINGFRRVVGIEVNDSIVNLDTKRFESFSNFSRIPGLEVHKDEGRSYITRSGESFDVIQASMVDTWAATSAGAMTLSENSLYTVEAWRIFYNHLNPGGIITFTRWHSGPESTTYRMFSVGWATLLSEGVANPADHIALVGSKGVATLLLSNEPFSAEDLKKLHWFVDNLEFKLLFVPGQTPDDPTLRLIAAARSLDDLAHLRDVGMYDYSPVFDASPFFFNGLRARSLAALLPTLQSNGNLRALGFVVCFMIAAAILLIVAILIPLKRLGMRGGATGVLVGGVGYFIAIGLGFMLVEIAMMQQLSIFLGHPIYAMAVVLSGLIFFAGLGSLTSEIFRFRSTLSSRVPAAVAVATVVGYSMVVLPLVHRYTGGVLVERILLSLALVGPCGFFMGFCFPVGLRWMRSLGQNDNLPWMWALNGAASVLASFLAVLLSMQININGCLLAGVACYAFATIALPWRLAAVTRRRMTDSVSRPATETAAA